MFVMKFLCSNLLCMERSLSLSLRNVLGVKRLTIKLLHVRIKLLVRGLAIKEDCWSGISLFGLYPTFFLCGGVRRKGLYPASFYGGIFVNAKTKSLFGYILPAMGGLFVTYLYNVVDGIREIGRTARICTISQPTIRTQLKRSICCCGLTATAECSIYRKWSTTSMRS